MFYRKSLRLITRIENEKRPLNEEVSQVNNENKVHYDQYI